MDIQKPMGLSSRPESCPDCNSQLTRVYQAPQVSCVVTRWSKAMGLDTANKHAVKAYLSRYHDKTGSRLACIGDQSLNSLKKSIVNNLPISSYPSAQRVLQEIGHA